eukprot:scaffold4502_cov119-Isochrysis_galbana.AAC.16
MDMWAFCHCEHRPDTTAPHWACLPPPPRQGWGASAAPPRGVDDGWGWEASAAPPRGVDDGGGCFHTLTMD